MDSNPLLRLDLRSHVQVIVEITITTLIIISAIFGNSLVCMAVYKTRRLRTISNMFLINLAVTDLLLATTVLPVVMQTQTTGVWSLGGAYCECQAFQSIYLFAVSLFTLTAISINRYFKITVNRQVHDAIFHKKSVKAMIVGIWIVAALLCMGPLMGWGRYKFDPKKALCSFDPQSSVSFRNTATLVIVVNMVTILACNLMIASAVRKHRRQVLPRSVPRQTGYELSCSGATHQGLEAGVTPCRTLNGSQKNQRVASRRGPLQTRGEDVHIAKTISLVVLLFFLSWLPNLIIDNLVLAGVHVAYEVRMFGVYTMFLDSVINPIIYAVRNRLFRKAFRDIFRCG